LQISNEHEIDALKKIYCCEPLEAKKLGMPYLYLFWHTKKEAESARSNFERKFSKHEYTEAMKYRFPCHLLCRFLMQIFAAFEREYNQTSIRALKKQRGYGDSMEKGKRLLFLVQKK